MALRRIFIPFGELTPDAREFNNEGLTQALNVVPVGDTYVPFRTWQKRSAALTGTPRGLHAHPSTSASTWYGYFGTPTALYEASNTGATLWTITDKTRAAGGPYASDVWHGASFGDAVLMTNYADDPQLLTSSASANFEKLAQSGAGNPGMDPKAKFAFPVRGNMFLAYLNLAAGFDGLSAGANPTVVCWSQSENMRQYGSFNVTPQLTGTGYQPLNYDLGAITGGIGGQYALIAMQRGWARADGPPYTFRPISQGVGCQCSKSIIRFDDDVYFWGPAGPMVFRGGEGPAIPIAKDKIARTLTDATFGGPLSPGFYSGSNPFFVSAGADHVNRQVWWSFPAVQETPILIYDVDSQRFSFQTPRFDGDPSTIVSTLFLQVRPEQFVGGWVPGRDLVGLATSGTSTYLSTPYALASLPTSSVFERGYLQLDPDLTSRITRIRPVFSLIAGSGTSAGASVDLSTKNRPFDDPVTQTFTAAGSDAHGWIVTPATTFADFHRIRLTLQVDARFVAEVPGVEVEFQAGGVFAA